MQENGGTFGGRYGRGGRPAEVGSAGPATPATVDKHLAAKGAKRALEMQHSFGKKLAKVMKQPQFMAPAVAALLPDPATARAAAGARQGSARSIPAQVRALMLCVRHVYGGGHLDAVRARVAQVEPAHIHMLVSTLRQEHGTGLCDTYSSLALSRAVAAVCEQTTTGMFTREELDECLVTAVCSPVTHYKLSSTYGVGVSTIGKYLGKMRQYMADAPLPRDELGVRKVLASMWSDGSLGRMGGVRLFTDDEEALIMGINTAQASVGAGMHRDLSRSVFREAAHAKGATMSRAIAHADNTGVLVLPSERAKAAQLLAATVDPKTYFRIKGRVNNGGLLAGAEVREEGKKAAIIEQARAKTNCPWLTQEMFQKIETKVQSLVDRGILTNPQNKPVLELLEPWMLLNLDEVGCPPEGKHPRIEAFKGLNHVAYLRGGVKAAYWITVCVITCAIGTVMPPFLVHQGKLGELNAANTVMGDVREDGKFNYVPKTWTVVQSESGYMVVDIFYDAAVHIVQNLGSLRPVILFMDGHGSHWSARALRYLDNNGVYVIFLRSQNSENDQPNDNGFNRKMHYVLSQCHAEWLIKYPHRRAMPFRACHFNEVLEKAWAELTSGSAYGTILRGWKLTGLWPLSVKVALEREGATATGMYMNAHKDDDMNTVLGAVLPGAAQLPDVDGDGRVRMPCAELGRTGTHLTAKRTLMSGAQLANPHAAVITLAIASAVHLRAVSAAEVVRGVNALKVLKAVKVMNGLKIGRNGLPDSTAGVDCNENVIRTCEEAEVAKAAREAAAIVAKSVRMAKQAVKLTQAQQTATKVRDAMAIGTAEEWHKVFTAAEVRTAAESMLAPTRFGTKPAAVAALNASWAQQHAAHVQVNEPLPLAAAHVQVNEPLPLAAPQAGRNATS